MGHLSEEADQDSRGWAMRRGHCQRLRGERGRESRRGRAAFARSVNIGDGKSRYWDDWSLGKTGKQRMILEEIAEGIDGFSDSDESECFDLYLAECEADCPEISEAAEEEDIAEEAAVIAAADAAELFFAARRERRPPQAQRQPSRWESASSRAKAAAKDWRPPKEEATPEMERELEKKKAEEKEREKEREKAARKLPSSFAELKEGFLADHRDSIVTALKRVFTGEVVISEAKISSAIQQRFMQQCQGGRTIVPALHGTKAENHSSIFEKGLLIPSRCGSGLAVANANSHGQGIYTAKLNNPYLSRGFCSEPRMLVCAVLDDAVPLPYPRPCGNFFITAESSYIRHVGDAVVVMDPARVVPIFEASGTGFGCCSSFVPKAVVPVPSIPPRPVVSTPCYSPPVAQRPLRTTEEEPVRKPKIKERKPPPAPLTGLARFLARRAVRTRLIHQTGSSVRC